MVTLKLFRRPTREQQEEVLAAASKRGFNYDARGGTKKLDDEEEVKAFKSNGYRVCSRKVRVGEGWGTYRKAKSKLKDWRQVQLGWTSVLPDTPVKKGAEVCLCARVLGVWIMNPLKTVYVQTKRTRMPIVNLVPMLPLAYNSAQFSHAEGTMKGHLLAGEERFSVSIDKKDKSVHYQVSSISKPDHILSRVGYPLVCLLQSNFIRQSTRSFQRELKEESGKN
mmetsp:Transcript_7689/g.14301  ORF Transcript_7689/g.14301 Transcript_7689/m.14301 type:complete len:223 (-) Transcript_7689:1353-2021(-)